MKSNDLNRFKLQLAGKCRIIGAHRLQRAAITIPLICIENEYHFLFEQRTLHIAQGGEICFPGGMFEPEVDTCMQDVAVRETCEELGIDRKKIEVLGNLGSSVTLRGIIVECFPSLITVNSLKDFEIDQSEVARIFTLPVEWFNQNTPQEYKLHVEMHPKITDRYGNQKILFPAEELDLPVKYHNSWKVNTQRVIVYDTPEGVVWGMTAAVIEAFLECRHVSGLME